MITVGITGGLGSGKSIVCKMFHHLGINVYEADAEAKKLYDLPEVLEKVKKEFGEHVFSTNGSIDKIKFAQLVFNNGVALKKINAIVHPFVKKKFKEWKKLYKDEKYVLMEAAILFESGANEGCHKVISVTSPIELRIGRVMERDKRTREQIEKIIQKQWTDEERIKRSDFVIINDEKKMLISQVLKIHENLLQFSGAVLKA